MITSKHTLQLIFAKSRILVSFLSALCVLCGYSSAQDWKTLHDGVEYARVEHKIGSDPVKINLLRLDLMKVRLDVHHALDKAIGLETTSSIAKRKGAVAAINSGFFRLDKSEWAGDASSVLAIDGRLLSESSNGRTAIFIKDDEPQQTIIFQPVDLGSGIQLFDDRSFVHALDYIGINRERKADELIIYTPEFHTTTLTNNDGLEVIVQNNAIFYIQDGKGSSPIPQNGFVLSASGTKRTELLNIAKLGRSVYQHFNTSYPFGTSKDLVSNGRQLGAFSLGNDIVAGVPQLIKNGKIDITWEQEKASRSFVETRHPRTAVAKLKGGKFLMTTVDGRQPGVSVGMTLQELAEYIRSLGATDAMNLDGGGSTTMYLDGKVVNTPSDKEGERKVGDAILVTLRKTK
jgi:hypothetical protein